MSLKARDLNDLMIGSEKKNEGTRERNVKGIGSINISEVLILSRKEAIKMKKMHM